MSDPIQPADQTSIQPIKLTSNIHKTCQIDSIKPTEEAPIQSTNKSLKNFFQELIVLNALANPPKEWRDSTKLIVSALLAISLWGFLGVIAFKHFQASLEFSRQLAATAPSDKGAVDRIDKAYTGVNETAKTLYALITPLATAITGYFFAASGSQSSLVVTPTNQLPSTPDESVDESPNP
ncbi:MAG TPA: hypothetical protein V6C85_02825 [Allocoleopsis sp.]